MHKSTINGEAPQFAGMPWWVSSGSQDEHVNSGHINQFDWSTGDQKSDNLDKSQHNQSAFSSADENKNSFKENNMHDHQTNGFPQFPLSQQKGYVELGLSQPVVNQVYTNYPLGDSRGLFTAYGTAPAGRVMLPFSLTTEDGPIYVNPKQYHGIMRRRKMRAKEGLKYKSSREKPYLHESRHRHACRRPRGVGGRFLNTKALDNQNSNQEQKKMSDHHQLPYHSSDSSASEVLQSDSLNLNSSKEVVSDNKSTNPSTSEVSSFYYNNEFDCFNINPARPFSFHPLANMESGRQGSNWAPATPDGCCDFFKL